MAQRPPDISAQQRRISRLLRQRDFVKFSQNLSEVLIEIWLAAGKIGLEALKEHLRGTAAFATGEIDDVIEILRGALSTDYGARIQPVVNGSVKHVYTLGQNEIKVGLAKSFNVVDHKAVSWLHQHHMYWSLNRYDNHFTERIKELGKEAIEKGMSRVKAGKFFEQTIGREVVRNKGYWELTADAITTRSRSFGTVEGLVKAGATKYVWDSVMDHRTSDICLELNGRVFEVSRAIEVRDKIIAAKTPEEAKEISPWIPENKFKEMSFEEIKAAGVVLPPAHGRCRARINIFE